MIRARGLTQQQVADRMGVTKGRVSQIERGGVSGHDVLARYAAALGGRFTKRSTSTTAPSPRSREPVSPVNPGVRASSDANPGGSVAYEPFDPPGCVNGVLVLPDPDSEPPCRRELSIGVPVATDDAVELQAPPAGVGLGQVAVLRARVPEAAVDEHRDPGTPKQDVDAPTTVPTRNRSVDDEPQAAPVESTAQSEFRTGAGSLGPLHHPPGGRRRRWWDQAGVEVSVHGTSISVRTDTSQRYGSPVRGEITTMGRLTGLVC